MNRWLRALIVGMVGLGGAILLSPTKELSAADRERQVVEVVRDPATDLPRYEPGILFIEPGDTVLFKNAGKFHASRIIPGMMPESAEPWWGQLGEDVEVTFVQLGVYGHKCGSSYPLGLVGLVVVGDASANLTSARAVQHPPAAARVFDALFDELDTYLAK